MSDTKLPADLQSAMDALRAEAIGHALTIRGSVAFTMVDNMRARALAREINAALDSLAAQAGAMIEAEREKVRRLREGLREAMSAVRIFHGECGWDIYESNAPEWKRWTALLAEGDGDA